MGFFTRRTFAGRINRRRVAATPRPRRGYSVEASRGDAAATRTFDRDRRAAALGLEVPFGRLILNNISLFSLRPSLAPAAALLSSPASSMSTCRLRYLVPGGDEELRRRRVVGMALICLYPRMKGPSPTVVDTYASEIP